MDGDEVEGVKWDAWNRALANIAGIIAVGGRRGDDALVRCYDIAGELRDKLRYSQGRLRSVKQEMSLTLASARSERHEARARLQELETEVARLAGAVQAQGSTLAARETVSQSQAAENDQLRRHVAALERQLKRAEEDRMVTVSERNDALRHLEKMSQLLEDSESRVAEVQAEHNELLGELVASKGRLADMSALETLYGAARDELERLDKENVELKDMVSSGGVQLGRSRILEALGIPDSSDPFAASGGSRSSGGALGGRRTTGRATSPVSGSRSGSGLTRSRSAPRTRRASSGLQGESYSGRASSPPATGRGLSPAAAAAAAGGGASPSLEDPVTEMAFLGPPSSAYPPDPENYVFYRVGGGYTPRLNPAQPTIPQPRASGWVPKDVVRLVQAFRHSYGLSLEWRFWEPLVLMIDEVYRSRADGNLASMRAAQQEKIKAIKRQVRSALCYPSAMANGKINYLQRQLNGARKVLAIGDRKGEVPLKQMALKDYQLGYQLDRAVEENYALRRSLEDLEELYNSAIIETAAAANAAGVGVGSSIGPKTPARGSAAASAAASTAAAAAAPGGGADSVRRSDAYSQLSPRRLRQHQQQHRESQSQSPQNSHSQHHQHRHHHRYGGGSFGTGAADDMVQLPLSSSRGGGANRASEAAFSRRTSMVSGLHGPGTDAATDVMSLGGLS